MKKHRVCRRSSFTSYEHTESRTATFWNFQGGKSSVVAEILGEELRMDQHEQQRHRQFLGLFASHEALDGFVRSLARRVGLFLDPSDISEPSQDGWRLLETAVSWCVETDGSEAKLKGTL